MPYRAVLLASWLTFMVVWAATARKANPSRRGTLWRRGVRLRLFIFVLAVVLARRFGLRLLRQTTGLVAVVGCALCVAGIACAVWARFSLGKNWGMPMSIRQKPELVTRGPYAFVRHPIYTAMTFALIGSALVLPAYWALVPLFVVYFVVSARREEQDMLAEFPEQYGAYRKRSKMFVPFLF